jgi:hypothetical protein
MKLLWILYRGVKGDRHILFLSLDIVGDFYIGLDTRLVGDGDRNTILTNREFPYLSLGAKIKFLNRNCPDAMKNAFRKLSKSRIVSISEYKIGSI